MTLEVMKDIRVYLDGIRGMEMRAETLCICKSTH